MKEEPAKKKKKKKAKKAKVAEPKKEEPKKVDTAAARKLEKQIEKQKKKAEKAAERAAKGEAPKESSGGGWTTVPTYVSTKPAPVVVVAADGSAPVAPRLEIDLGDCVGKIIGRKGANIQLIQETSGVSLAARIFCSCNCCPHHVACSVYFLVYAESVSHHLFYSVSF